MTMLKFWIWIALVSTAIAHTCKQNPSLTELDCLYFPPQWPRDGASAQQMLDRYGAAIKKAQEKLNASSITKATHKLGNDEREAFDVYGPTTAESVLIWLHGGYWQFESMTRADVAPMVKTLVSGGTSVVSIGYKLASPARPLTAITKDVVEAIKKVLALFPENTRVVIGGHSAGGQLAFKAVAQLKSPRIKGLLLVASILDLTELQQTFIGKNIGMTVADAKASSCRADELTPGEVEVLILVGEYDTPKFRGQAKEMHEGLWARNVDSQWVELPNEDHLSLVEEFTDETKTATKLLKKFCSTSILLFT